MIDYFAYPPTNIQGYIWEGKQGVSFDLKCTTESWNGSLARLNDPTLYNVYMAPI